MTNEISNSLRTALQRHVASRLARALSRIEGSDAAAKKRRQDQEDFYCLQPLLDSAPNCTSQIQIATHIAKGVHPGPSVRDASSLLVRCDHLPAIGTLGSHTLGAAANVDATGNGAYNRRVYELYLLTQVEYQGVALLDLLRAGDMGSVEQLSSDHSQAARIASALVDIEALRSGTLTTHALAKQIYWFVGTDPHDNQHFHLLAPLYPTSLIHRLYLQLQDDRFSKEAKAAREARRQGVHHERGVREYPQLAIQKLGGTKPQNVSQLNSERGGNNALLASLPPIWQRAETRPLFGSQTLFDAMRWRRGVRSLTTEFRAFLESNPANNISTREQRDAYIERLLEEVMQMTAELQTLPSGWTQDERCRLKPHHAHWLDPGGAPPGEPAVHAAGSTAERMAADFAHWLNEQLRDPLPLGDPEFHHWRKMAKDLFEDMQWEVADER